MTNLIDSEVKMLCSLISLGLLAVARGLTQSIIEMQTHYNDSKADDFNFELAPEERLGMPKELITLPNCIVYQTDPSDLRWSLHLPYKLASQKANYHYSLQRLDPSVD